MLLARPQPEERADAGWITRGPGQAHAQSWPGRDVPVEPGLRAVLCHHEVHSSVAVEIARGRAALLTVHRDPALLTRHGVEPALAIALQQQAAPGIVPRHLGREREEILTEKKILRAVPVEVRCTHRKSGRELGWERQRRRFESIAAIEEYHRVESDSLKLLRGLP